MFQWLQRRLYKKPYEVSIIIPTYDNVEFLEECISSVMASASKFCEYEILLGIDNCNKTLSFVGSNKLFKNDRIKIYYFPKNVGPYIVRNSLAAKAKYDNILFFDSDDVMMENAIQNLMENFVDVELIKFKFCNFENGKNYNDPNNLTLSPFPSQGPFLIKKTKFYKMGGFFGWKCAADTEFMERYDGLKNEFIILDTPIFYRRYHKKNITRSEITGLHSALRSKYGRYILDNRTNEKWSNPKTPQVFKSYLIKL